MLTPSCECELVFTALATVRVKHGNRPADPVYVTFCKCEPDATRSHPGGNRLRLADRGRNSSKRIAQKLIHGKKDFSDELKNPFSKSFFPACSE
jgi:hypothetical protein